MHSLFRWTSAHAKLGGFCIWAWEFSPEISVWVTLLSSIRCSSVLVVSVGMWDHHYQSSLSARNRQTKQTYCWGFSMAANVCFFTPIPCSYTCLSLDGMAKNCLSFNLHGYARSCNLSCLVPFIFSYLLCLRRVEKPFGLSWNRTQVLFLHKRPL